MQQGFSRSSGLPSLWLMLARSRSARSPESDLSMSPCHFIKASNYSCKTVYWLALWTIKLLFVFLQSTLNNVESLNGHGGKLYVKAVVFLCVSL